MIANLALLGYALKSYTLFCSAADTRKSCAGFSPPKQLELNLKGLRLGLGAS
jgi:hypothetical protein